MNQKILWTTAALFSTIVGIPSVGRSQTTKAPAPNHNNVASGDVLKVGEYQPPAAKGAENAVIAKIQPHTVAGRQAATLYIRNIPVLTFLGSTNTAATPETKIGTVGNGTNATFDVGAKVATIGNYPDLSNLNQNNSADPVLRASQLAAKINQINLSRLDDKQITVSWKGNGDSNTGNQTASGRYAIKFNGEPLVEINADTRLADTTNNAAKDALQATNRMRRLISSAPPLTEIYGLPIAVPPPITTATAPRFPTEIKLGPVKVTLKGWASWYGPGFHGNRTAAGERYNQNAMTAAHKTLPFGTQVRVTNKRNGRSVVVRINDRGPFIRGRIIDLSAAAARMLGMMDSGVAPVQVEVLRNQR